MSYTNHQTKSLYLVGVSLCLVDFRVGAWAGIRGAAGVLGAAAGISAAAAAGTICGVRGIRTGATALGDSVAGTTALGDCVAGTTALGDCVAGTTALGDCVAGTTGVTSSGSESS